MSKRIMLSDEEYAALVRFLDRTLAVDASAVETDALSAIAKVKDASSLQWGRKPKYPFDTLPVGHTFKVDAADAPDFASFRSYVYNRNRTLGKTFLCHKHEDGSIEVYRKA